MTRIASDLVMLTAILCGLVNASEAPHSHSKAEQRDYYKIHQGRKKALGLASHGKMPDNVNLSRLTDDWKGMTKDARDARRKQILGLTRSGNLPRHLKNIPSKVLTIMEERLAHDPHVSRESAMADAFALTHYTPKTPDPNEEPWKSTPKKRFKTMCKREKTYGKIVAEEEIARTNARLSGLLAPNPSWYCPPASPSLGSRASSSRDQSIVTVNEAETSLRAGKRPLKPLFDLNEPGDVE